MIKKFNIAFILFLILLCFSGCSSDDEAINRGNLIKENDDFLKIGVGWPLQGGEDPLKKGVELAVEKINSTDGVLGRKVIVDYKDDEADISRGLRIANEFSSDKSILSVIGHRNSYISATVSNIYKEAGILMISPGSTMPKLTQMGNHLFLRTMPSDIKIAEYAAKIAGRNNYKNIIIYYENNDYGRGLANAFEDFSPKFNLNIIDRRSIESGTKQEFEHDLNYFELLDFDAFFLAGVMPIASDFVNYARERGFEQMIFGGDGLDSKEFLDALSNGVEDVISVSVFNSKKDDKKVEEFIRDYYQKYQIEPDIWAAQGYDAVNLLMDSVETSGFLNPEKLSKYIKNLESWEGVTGKHVFSSDGDLSQKDVVIKHVKNGVFNILNEGELKNE
ncbi:MAG: ABC transporter substrate-binding protein [Candidatus Muiribacteriota bacterium]